MSIEIVPTKVYRFEKFSELKQMFIGPYCFKYEYDDFLFESDQIELCDNHDKSDNHPSLWQDFRSKFNSNHLSACLTVELLFDWFKDFLDFLKKYNFELVEYTIWDSRYVKIGESGKQCIFEMQDVDSKKIINY